MRNLVFRKLTDNFLKTLRQQRLPIQISVILATNADELNNLAIMTDKINEEVTGSRRDNPHTYSSNKCNK